MALKIQYNKTYLQLLNRGLKVRENALPTLQAKESALRLEVKKAKEEVAEVARQLERQLAEAAPADRLWSEFPAKLVKLGAVDIQIKKIAGVKTPVFGGVTFEVKPYSMFNQSAWVPQGIELARQIAALNVRKQVAARKMEILEYARKKTTQKVNLYEKVQIPEFREALLKIKRFLEDEDNLAKSSQKILKARLAAAEAVA